MDLREKADQATPFEAMFMTVWAEQRDLVLRIIEVRAKQRGDDDMADPNGS